MIVKMGVKYKFALITGVNIKNLHQGNVYTTHNTTCSRQLRQLKLASFITYAKEILASAKENNKQYISHADQSVQTGTFSYGFPL